MQQTCTIFDLKFTTFGRHAIEIDEWEICWICLFIRDTFLVLNTLNNPQERQYILNRLTMDGTCWHLFSVFVTFMSVVMQNICILTRRAWGEVLKKNYKFWDFYIQLINIGLTQKAFLSIGNVEKMCCIDILKQSIMKLDIFIF